MLVHQYILDTKPHINMKTTTASVLVTVLCLCTSMTASARLRHVEKVATAAQKASDIANGETLERALAKAPDYKNDCGEGFPDCVSKSFCNTNVMMCDNNSRTQGGKFSLCSKDADCNIGDWQQCSGGKCRKATGSTCRKNSFCATRYCSKTGLCAEKPEEPDALVGITNGHNVVRSNEAASLSPLVWDSDIASVAQAYAEQCVYAHNSLRNEQYGSVLGENMYASTGDVTADRVVSSWAREKQDYDYKTNSCSGICGHYTQMIWDTSTRLGCGFAYCPDLQIGSYTGWNIVVCNYNPAGNYVGHRPY